MRVIITGSRDWIDSKRIYRRLKELPKKSTIVHGDSPNGADVIADDVSQALNFKVEKFKAKWNNYGRKAGPIRNMEMARSGADLCIAFWDGKSRGTANMIQEAMRKDIPVEIHYSDGKVMYPEGTVLEETA